MTITLAAAAIAALFSTLITALWNQTHWSATAKRTTSGVVALVLGIAVALASNQIIGIPPDWIQFTARWILILGGVAVGAQGFYLQFQGFFKKITDATSLTPATTDNAEVTGAVISSEQPADTAAETVAEDTSGTPPDEVQEG